MNVATTSNSRGTSADLRSQVIARIADGRSYTTTEIAHELDVPPADVRRVYRKILAERGEDPRLERSRAARQRAMDVDLTK